jgi:hypothetical protein
MAWLILPKLKRLCLLCQTSYNEGMEIFLGICFPLFITLAVETPLVLWIMNRYDPSFALFVVAVNVATNLALTTLTYYVMKPYGAYNPPLLFLAELVIALIEAASYAIYTRKVGYAFLASFMLRTGLAEAKLSIPSSVIAPWESAPVKESERSLGVSPTQNVALKRRTTLGRLCVCLGTNKPDKEYEDFIVVSPDLAMMPSGSMS